MIVIEIRDVPPEPSPQAKESRVPHFFDVELLVSSPALRCLCAFVKGAIAGLLVLGFAGVNLFGSWFPIIFVSYVASLFCLCTWTDQRLSHQVSSKDVLLSLKHDLSCIHPASLALIPMSILLLSMNMQSLLNILANLIEVAGIAFGVPLLMYGAIKWTEQESNAIGHVKLGAAIVASGISLSLIFGILTARLTDINSFSPANYFSDAISAIYLPVAVIDATSRELMTNTPSTITVVTERL